MGNHEEMLQNGTDHACDSGNSERKSHHSDKKKSNLVARLNRIEGQIRGIKGLIEKDWLL